MGFLAVLIFVKISRIVAGFSVTQTPEVPCLTPRCIQSAASILQSMNQSYDPCEDFFSYTCGNYYKDHPIPDSQIMNDLNRRKEREYELKAKVMLQEDESDSDPESVKKAKTLFRSCTNTGAIEELGFQPIIDALAVAGLPLIPSPPNDSFDWLLANVEVQKKLGKEILLQFALYTDPQNKTLKLLGVGVPTDWSLVTQPHRQHQRDYDSFKRNMFFPNLMKVSNAADIKDILENETYDASNYEDEINYGKNVLGTFLAETDHDFSESRIRKIKKALADAIVIDNTIELLQTAFNSLENSTKHTLKELQTMLDSTSKTRQKSQINLSRFFTEMFDGIENVTLHLTDDTPVMAGSVEYLLAISTFAKKLTPRRLAMVFWWRIVKNLTPVSTRALRELAQDFRNAQFGFEYDVKSRALLCTQVVLQAFPFAVGHKIMDRNYLQKIKPGVEEMFENLRRSFKQNIESYKWIESTDRQIMTDKLDAIKLYVGLPEWIFDVQEIDGYYSDVSVCEEHFAHNLINFSSLLVISSLSSFNQTVDPEEDAGSEWGSVNMFTSNAFYFPEENSMIILLPQLEHPFYDLGLEALNYGALGSLIGHELSHAFDNTGRTYDRVGNKVAKWTNTSVSNYMNKTECLVDQYNSVYIPEVDQHVDGRKTLNENIADNSALRLALAAYRMCVQSHGKEKPLPGLENFSHEQLLFISFASVDCYSISDAAMLNMLADEHSPTRVRINVTLSNTQDFYSAWKCKNVDSPDHRKCRLL